MNYYSSEELAEKNRAAEPEVQTLWQCSPPGHLHLCSGRRCPMGQEKVLVWIYD